MICLRNQRAPSVIPCVEGGRRNSGFLSYGYERLCRAVVNNVDVVALVDTLFFSCRPAAVLRGVWAVIIDALNAVFGARSTPHVGKELIERLLPAIANKNSTPAVIFVRLIRGVAAALSHVHPAYVLRAVRQSVARFRLGYLGSRLAPAPRAFPTIEIPGMNVFFFAAYAQARDVCHRIGSVRISNNCPISERGSDRGDNKSHVDPLFLMAPLHYSSYLIMIAGG